MRLLLPTLAGALLASASADTWSRKEAGFALSSRGSSGAAGAAAERGRSPARWAQLQRKQLRGKSAAAHPASQPLALELALRGGAASKAAASEDADEEEDVEEEEEEAEDEEEEETDAETAAAVKKLLLDEGPADKVLRVAQAVGHILGEVHAALAQAPTLGLLLSNAMFAQLGGSLLMMKISNRVDFNDGPTLFKIRVFYTASMLFVQGAYCLIRHAAWRRGDETEVVTSNALLDGLLKATKAPDGEPDEGGGWGLADMAAAATRSVQTAAEYDLKLAKRASAALFPSMCMMYFFHFKRDWHRAVLCAPVGPLIQLFSDPLFQIHILGRPATGPLQRPFKSAQQRMMAEMGVGKEGDEGADAEAATSDEAEATAAAEEATEPRGLVVEEATDDEGAIDDEEGDE